MTKHLTSPNNPLIKQAVQLKHKARERRVQELFIAEGLREVKLALQNGFEATHLFYDPQQTTDKQLNEVLHGAVFTPNEIITVNDKVLDKIAYRSSVPNVVCIFKNKSKEVSDLPKTDSQPLILVLEGIEKPGNLGAILRTADAAGVNAILVCEPDFDLYNPNAIRSSLGAIFSLPVFELSSQNAVAYLKEHHIPIYATYLEATKSLYSCDLTKATALVLGAEATGITDFWIEQADHRIIIPMAGQVDSMNVSVSAAIVMFEAVRQRGGSEKGERVRGMRIERVRENEKGEAFSFL